MQRQFNMVIGSALSIRWWATCHTPVKLAVENDPWCVGSVFFQTWLISGPLQRLNLKPQAMPAMGLYPRTERRALSMLLFAIPENVRDELIASRKLTVDQLLFSVISVVLTGGIS